MLADPAVPEVFWVRFPKFVGALLHHVSSSASSPACWKAAMNRYSWFPPAGVTAPGSGVVLVPVAIVESSGALILSSPRML